MPTLPDLILVDGSSYLYRAFHALPPLSNSRGEPTGAIHGVLNMLHKLLRDYPGARLAVVFDAPGKTFRDELFAEYKSHRPPMPDDLRAQIEPLLAIVTAMGLPLLRIGGVEADDVIGTLARSAAAAGRQVLISTGDKDMAQLVEGHVTLINTMSDTLLDRAGVKAKFDVWPEQIIDYLALVGDSSDNIPGIEKVGPKTAAKWLAQHPTLDELVAHAADIPGKAGENLRAGLATLELSRRLATIRCDVELPPEAAALQPRPADTGSLRELYAQLEMRSFLRQLDGEAAPGPRAAAGSAPASAAATPAADAMPAAPLVEGAHDAITRRYEIVTTQQQLAAWIDKLRAAPLVCFDTETTSLDYMAARIVGVSFAVTPGVAAYVPLAHDYPGAPDQLPLEATLAALKPLLEDPQLPKLGANLKYDAHVLANHGIALAGQRYDTMLENYVLDSTQRHDMDSMAARHLGLKTVKFEEIAGKGVKQLTFNQVSIDIAANYSAEDADITLRLHEALWPRIAAVAPLRALYEEVEQPLVPVLLHMERDGVLIDRAMLQRQSSELGGKLEELATSARREAGQDFNLDSPKQLQAILFEKLQIPVLRKTATGQPSTAEDVLEELAPDHALPRLILEYRGLAKLRSTYTEKLPLQIDADTGRVHTSYNQTVAATGRLSSTDPNLQNIPVRSPEGRRIRQAFIAPPGAVLLAADYSQIELRIMAHLSGDEGLLRAFAEDRDVHQATAAEVFGVALEAVNSDMRRSAKAINFGLIYGMSAFGLARQLGIDRGAAQRYVDTYFARYPGVRRYMDDTRALAKRAGYVETVFGRRLYLAEINSKNRAMQQYAERSAINAPMQGTAADIIKRAMITVDAWCRGPASPAKLVMQVHDELVFEVAATRVAEASARIRALMVEAATLKVPLKVDIGQGNNWDEAH
jgi:DNA polymerase-1